MKKLLEAAILLLASFAHCEEPHPEHKDESELISFVLRLPATTA